MKILAFATSNSTTSINKKLVKYASDLLNHMMDDVQIESLDIHNYEMSIYSADREAAHGIPQRAKQFFAKIGAADALLISFSEHNGGYSAAYKNLFDWTSRINSKVYQGKPTIALATSPGPGGASHVLASTKVSAPFFAANIKADLSVPRFYDNFDQKVGQLNNLKLKNKLKNALETLK